MKINKVNMISKRKKIKIDMQNIKKKIKENLKIIDKEKILFM
jgi:hypothetical protein